MQNREGLTYVITPIEVYFNKELSPADRTVWWVINTLDTTNKHCFASNSYIAQRSLLKERTVTLSISRLIELGYIKQAGFDGRRRTLIVEKNLEKFRYILEDYNQNIVHTKRNDQSPDTEPKTTDVQQPCKGDSQGRAMQDSMDMPHISTSDKNNNNYKTDSFLKRKKESEANQGFAHESGSSLKKPTLKLRKKPIVVKNTKADDIRNKKSTLAKPTPEPVVIPQTIQEYLDVWTKADFKVPAPNTKSFAKVIIYLKKLKRGTFFRDKPEYNAVQARTPLSIEHWEMIVERYKNALKPEYLPNDKSWLQKLNILTFIWNPFNATCPFMEFSLKEPELRIQNVHPDITKNLISCYAEDILNNPTYKPPDKDMEKFILAGNRTGEFFKQNAKRIPIHFNLTTYKKAQLVIRAVKNIAGQQTDMITPGFLCSDTTFNIRLPKYLNDQAMFK